MAQTKTNDLIAVLQLILWKDCKMQLGTVLSSFMACGRLVLGWLFGCPVICFAELCSLNSALTAKNFKQQKRLMI